MKKLLLISVFLAGIFLTGMSLGKDPVKGNGKVIIDNDKLQVVEFVSAPGGGVCGPGMHEHAPHLTVVLAGGKVKVTTPDGESQDIELASGSAIWFGPDKHEALNIGDSEMKVLLVYLK